MIADDDLITVTLPDVDVRRALAIAPRVTDGFDKLWAAGRLRGLMRSPEGETVLRIFTEGHLSAVKQLLRASADGQDLVTITAHAPREDAPALLAFVRRLFEMLAEPETMAAVGAAPLHAEDVAFAEPLIAYAEGIVAAYPHPSPPA